jgi:glycosyltransferase involved in cell wall biosynthesis
VFNLLAAHPDVALDVIGLSSAIPGGPELATDQIAFNYRVLRSLLVGRALLGDPLYLNPDLLAHLHRGHYDVVICGGYSHPSFWLALWYGRVTGKHMVLWSESTRHIPFRAGNPKHRFKQWLIRAFDAYIVPGSPHCDYLCDFGVPPERIYTAPNAVNTRFFAEATAGFRARKEQIKQELGISGPVALYVGRLVDERPAGLIGAFAARTWAPGTLLIVGDGPQRAL